LIGHFIIDLIDETGYFSGDVEELAERLAAPIEEVEAVLQLVQTLEPSGVGARSLRECLAIQLAERDRLDPAMAVMLDNLELVAKRNIAALRRLCDVDEDDILEMIAELRALTAKPGLAFGSMPIQP